MTFTRAAFGPRGNRPHAFLAWVTSVAFEAINCVFGVFALLALAAYLGWEDPGAAGKVLATLAIVGGSAAIAVYGHGTMVVLQRGFAIGLALTLLVVIAYALEDVDWARRGAGELASEPLAARILAAGAVIAAGPISYLYNAADWVRYLPSRTSGRAIFLTVLAGSGAIALCLSAMGVLLASRGDMSDPIAGVRPFVPGWVFVLYIAAAVGGSVANNVVTYYSSGLCLQSLGLPLRRHLATAADVVVATAIVLTILFVQDFTTALEDFVSAMVIWLGPFAAVWITDGVMRRWRYDPVAAHDLGPGGAYWARGGVNPRGWIALLAGASVSLLGEPLSGADLTWTLGPLVSALVYWAEPGSIDDRGWLGAVGRVRGD
jgi:purine-cytosine permease-like protein